MKTLIIGMKGTGKTKLIIEEIIPALDKFLVIDFHDEYGKYEGNRILFKANQTPVPPLSELKGLIVQIIRNTPAEFTIILDNISLVGNNLGWLNKEIQGKNVVIVLQSISAIKSKSIHDSYPDCPDVVYCFKTLDKETVRTKYIEQQPEKGVKLYLR